MIAVVTKQLATGALEWLAWSFALNLAWEIAQLPLYAFPAQTSVWSIAFALAHCTLGDVMVALIAYLAAAGVTRNAAWPLERAVAGLVVAICVGTGWTLWAEWNAVYITRAWTYAASMPLIGGVGLSPVLQSLALPPITLAIVRVVARRRTLRSLT